jgi:vancomycin aglycone glucosyltransferase
MCVFLMTYGSRGDIQPLVGLAVQVRERGAEVQVCAPPHQEFVELLAGVGVPLVPMGRPVRALVTKAIPSAAADLPPCAAELVAAQFGSVAAAAEECDAPVATGVMPTGGWR